MLRQLCPGLFSGAPSGRHGCHQWPDGGARRVYGRQSAARRLWQLAAVLLLAMAAPGLQSPPDVLRAQSPESASPPDKQARFHWPITRGQYPDLRGLTSTFGESRGDHFHNGLDIAALGDPVHPVADGVVLYSRLPGDDPFAPEQGPGNFVYVYHGQGWSSGYYHLQATDDLARKGKVQTGGAIGRAGNTGHSAGPHLHFFIARDNGERLLNPLYVLPAATDENPPVIGQINIITPEGRTLISHSRPEQIRLTRPYPILINILDPGYERYTRRGVYRLSWQLGDGPVGGYNFSTAAFVDGDWRLEGGQVFDDVYRSDLYHLAGIEFQNGRNLLRVRAHDHSGNVTEVEFDITVDRQY